MTRAPKDIAYWKSMVLRDWPSRAVLALLTVFCGYVWTHGRDTIKVEGQKLVLETVKPGMDSLKAQVDTLKAQVSDLKAEQEKQGRVQQEFFGAMMEVIPGLKKSVQDLGKQNASVATKKAENQTLLDNLTEIKP
jgi:cell division protein FtsB